jgi:hypothetical protein
LTNGLPSRNSNSRWRKRGDLMIRDAGLCEAARDRLRYQNNPRRQAFADDRPILNAPTRDIDCSSSILGSDIECAEIVIWRASSSIRRSVDAAKSRPSSDDCRRGPRIK